MSQRRGNGLPADSFMPLAPLPRDRADALLDALRGAGIAAYAVDLPVEEGEGAGTALLEPPSAVEPEEVTDHVFVDASAHTRAVEVLRSLSGAPEPGTEPAEDRDSQWEDLVARFYDSGSTDPSLWPDAENVAGGARDPKGPEAAAGESQAFGQEAAPRRQGPDTDDEGHYVPPPPPPLPSGTVTTRLAWAGVLGGPTLAVVMVVLLGRSLPPWLGFCIVAGFIAGFVVLVLRMEDRPPRSSDPDDGAVT